MKNFLSFIRHNQNNIFKAILTLLTIVIVVSVFPKRGNFKYEFQKGKPWLQADLITPFSFAVYKSEAEILSEHTEIKASEKLYYRVNSDLSNEKIATFKTEFNSKWEASKLSEQSFKNFTKKGFNQLFKKKSTLNSRDAYLDFGKKILQIIYQKGIIIIDERLEGKGPDFELITLNKNIAEDNYLKEFFTIKTAYKYIETTLAEKDKTVREFLEPLLENALSQNVTYDDELTKKVFNDAINSISLTRGAIQKDQRVIAQGDIITDEIFEILHSFKLEYQEIHGDSSNHNSIVFGQILLVSMLIGLLIAFLGIFRKDIFTENDKIAFLLLMVALMVYLGSISAHYSQINVYILPFCILPVLIRTFYDVRLAIFTHTITILLVSFLVPNSFEFTFIQLVAGIAALFFIVSIQKRSQIFITSIVIFIAYSLSYLGFSVIQEGSFESLAAKQFGWFGISALLTLSSYPLMYVFEKTFNFLSDVTLMELSDTNSTLLRKLAETAPGTFQHSMQVANLAESATRTIGGNPLLIRTGALYHDIGKMKNPAFFIENQSGINPHDELSPLHSSKIIIDHVISGIELAKKHRLPDEIIDFIRTHHGTSMTGYFYATYKQQHPDEEIDKQLFSYPGPMPFSKETAILMMADACEAASRSLKKPNEKSITKLIEAIIDGQVNAGQFTNAPITFKDISTIKKIFIKKLLNIYHVRIEYPKS